ncbi:phosphotransferase [Streptomyces coeruleoprunus]|uniref:Phosphotransferase n=1 Tax=Streptomyces coeruleoprunus TaxID=285563 RepID=A0ABV9XB33_9ACTN
MTVTAPAGSEEWVRQVLTVQWGEEWGVRALRPLTVDGAVPLTHTAGLWNVTTPDGDHVLKVQLDAGAVRDERFYPLKDRIVTHCRLQGVPALPVVPAADGSPSVRHGGLAVELVPRSPGSAVAPGTREQAAAIVRTGLDLRQALDELPPGTSGELATVHLPLLVEEEHWPTALDDAERRLLPKALRGTGPWHRAAAATLRELHATVPLLRRTFGDGDHGSAGPTPEARRAVVHGDLHLHHFLLARQGPARVLAVLDFDNLHVGDRLLDLAWLADTAAYACGDDTDGARAVLARLLADGRRRGLLGPGDEALLMPLLMAHSLPVVVDIAKDILDRGILSPQWLGYFALLSPARRLAVHRLLTAPAPH